MKRSQALAALLALTIVCPPSLAFGQGFSFGTDEAEKQADQKDQSQDQNSDDTADTQNPAGIDSTSDDDQSSDDVGPEQTGPKQVAVVAVPSKNMDEDRRAKVQQEMEKVASKIPNITVLSGSSVLGALQDAGGEDCVREPLCLADVGDQAHVERILLARVDQKPDGLELKVDYFDVGDKLFIKYKIVNGLGGTPAIVKAIKPALDDVFEVRTIRKGPNTVGPENSGIVQSVLAYGTAGLAVASLGAGIVFGINAKKAEKDVKNRAKNGDVYVMTQVQAREAIRSAKSKATTANIFYGLAIGLGAVSALLFYIKGGSDVGSDTKQDDANPTASLPIRDFHIAPAVSEHGLGFGAGFRF